MGQGEAQVPLLCLKERVQQAFSEDHNPCHSLGGGGVFALARDLQGDRAFLSVLLRVDSTAFPHCSNPEDGPTLQTNKVRASRLKPGKHYCKVSAEKKGGSQAVRQEKENLLEGNERVTGP